MVYENLSIDVRMHVPSKFPKVVQKCASAHDRVGDITVYVCA